MGSARGRAEPARIASVWSCSAINAAFASNRLSLYCTEVSMPPLLEIAGLIVLPVLYAPCWSGATASVESGIARYFTCDCAEPEGRDTVTFVGCCPARTVSGMEKLNRLTLPPVPTAGAGTVFVSEYAAFGTAAVTVISLIESRAKRPALVTVTLKLALSLMR